jgi:nitroreductase
MELNEAIFGRRATREYTKQTVDDATVEQLIAAGVHAPSAVNQQPWTFTVVRNQGILDLLSRDAKSHVIAAMPAPAPPPITFMGRSTTPTFISSTMRLH